MAQQHTNQKLTPAEIYSFNFSKDEPKFYTMIPNIIDHLTYVHVDKDGKKERRKLSIYAKELYRIIRMTAADDGICWRSLENMGELIGCAASTLCDYKKELLMPMEQLDGKSLIIQEKRKKALIKNGEIIGKSTYCTYTIENIWPWNNAYMATIKFQPEYEILEEEADSPGESGGGADSPSESAYQGADSPGERNNNNPSYKIPLFKEQQPTPVGDFVASSDTGLLLFPADASKQRAYDWLVSEGCLKKSAYNLANEYSAQDIGHASKYTSIQLARKTQKNEPKPDKFAYLTATLRGRFWESKK